MENKFCYAKEGKSEFKKLLRLRELTKELAIYLGGKYSNNQYENLRRNLIQEFGYEKFRDIQKRAFELICSGSL